MTKKFPTDETTYLKIIYPISWFISSLSSAFLIFFIMKNRSIYSKIMYQIILAETLFTYIQLITSYDFGNFSCIVSKFLLFKLVNISKKTWIQLNLMFQLPVNTYTQCLNSFLSYEIIKILKNPISQLQSRTKIYVLVSFLCAVVQFCLILIVSDFSSNQKEADIYKIVCSFYNEVKYFLLFNLTSYLIVVILGIISTIYLMTNFWCGKFVIKKMKYCFVLRHCLYFVFYVLLNLVWNIFLFKSIFFEEEYEKKKNIFFFGKEGTLLIGFALIFFRFSETSLRQCIGGTNIDEQKDNELETETAFNFFGSDLPLTSVMANYMNVEFMCCILYGLVHIYKSGQEKEESIEIQKNQSAYSRKSGINFANSFFLKEKVISDENVIKFYLDNDKFKLNTDKFQQKIHYKIKYQTYFEDEIEVDKFQVQVNPNYTVFNQEEDIKTVSDNTKNFQKIYENNPLLSPEVIGNLNSTGETSDAEIVEYAHFPFKALQQKENFKLEDLIESLQPLKNKEKLRKMKESQGKSGSFFFFSHDNRLLIKTISDEELDILLNKGLLLKYFQHIFQKSDSLLSRILGIFTVIIRKVSRIHIILMQNLNLLGNNFESLEYIFDLKGSLYGRKTKDLKNVPKGQALKDLDFLYFKKTKKVNICFQKDGIREIFYNLYDDLSMLRDANLMDYSLLLYIIRVPDEKEQPEDNRKVWELFGDEHYFRHVFKSNDPNYVYLIGIIDYLQYFNLRKFFESKFKVLLFRREINLISAVDPILYSTRLLRFAQMEIFIEKS